MKVWVKSLIGTILTLLGFHSCDPSTVIEEPEMYGPGPDKWEDMTAEYGSPYVVYKINGEATDQEGNPIEGIRMIVKPNGSDSSIWETDTLYTGADGKVAKTIRNYDSLKPDKMLVSVDDVDGEEHGSFESKTLDTDALSIERTGESVSSWDWGGEYTITAKAVLEKKESE